MKNLPDFVISGGIEIVDVNARNITDGVAVRLGYQKVLKLAQCDVAALSKFSGKIRIAEMA